MMFNEKYSNTNPEAMKEMVENRNHFEATKSTKYSEAKCAFFESTVGASAACVQDGSVDSNKSFDNAENLEAANTPNNGSTIEARFEAWANKLDKFCDDLVDICADCVRTAATKMRDIHKKRCEEARAERRRNVNAFLRHPIAHICRWIRRVVADLVSLSIIVIALIMMYNFAQANPDLAAQIIAYVQDAINIVVESATTVYDAFVGSATAAYEIIMEALRAPLNLFG